MTLAESALAPQRELTPKVAAFLYGQLAVGAAHAGDAATCRQAQRQAAALLARSGPQDEPLWIYWFTEANVQGIAGRSLLALGKPAEAEPHLRAMVAMLDPSFTRDRALWMCDLATARIGAGSIDQGCAMATEAATVIRRLDSPRDKRRLATTFRQAAAPYAKTTAVRDFDTRYRDLAEPSKA